MLAGRRILVTGGAGFVGSNLVRDLVQAGASQVVVVDNFLSSNPTDVLDADCVRLVKGSITNDRVLASLRDEFDHVFHLVTYHGNQSSIAGPLADHENNTLPTLKLFDHLAGFKRLRSVVYSSAGCTVAEKTYDDARPTREDDPVSLHLDSPYQISKIVGEMYAHYYKASAGLPVVIVRFQNVYGPWEILGAGRWRGTPETVWRNVTPTFIYRALKGLPLQLENAGRSTRDMIYVADIVRGLEIAATIGRPGETYNLASGAEVSIRELAELIVEESDSRSELILAPRRTWDRSGRRFGSTEKATAELGFVARTDLQRGIGATVAWTREHLPMIEASIARHDPALRRYLGEAAMAAAEVR